MSIRSTGFFVSAGDVTVVFTTGAIQIAAPTFLVNPVHIVFTPAQIQLTGETFTTKRLINYDNGFMAF